MSTGNNTDEVISAIEARRATVYSTLDALTKMVPHGEVKDFADRILQIEVQRSFLADQAIRLAAEQRVIIDHALMACDSLAKQYVQTLVQQDELTEKLVALLRERAGL